MAITGASTGVGRATSAAFAREGAAVGLITRGQLGLEAARHDVTAARGTGLVVPTEVSDAAQVEAAADRIESGLGP